MAVCPNSQRVTAFPSRSNRISRPTAKERPQMPNSADSQFQRLPGLFRLWELNRVIEPGEAYRIEGAGTADDGTPLYSIYTTKSARSAIHSRQEAEDG